MSKTKTAEEKTDKFIYRTPRLLGIIFVLFLMMFSLDVFGTGLTARETIIALFIHNIPALFLLIILIISWKYEIVGGIVFILTGFLYILTLIMGPNFEWYMLSWLFTISGPAFFVGILFMINWNKKRVGNKNC